MPRPLWKPLAFATVAAALPPPVLHAALAATAGTLFEAAPFVLLAEAAAGPGRRTLPVLAALAGCGCPGRLPGAVSLPATALAWLAFGPAVALARLVAGLARCLPAVRRGAPCGAVRAAHGGDALAELAALALPAFAAALAAQALTAHSASLHAAGAPGALLAFGAGTALGALVPCATAGVAIAAALAGALPPAAAGLLVSAGLFGLRRAGAGPAGQAGGAGPAGRAGDRAVRESRAAGLLLAVALAALALRGPAGLVNPRLLPLALAGAALAALRLRRPQAATATGAFVPVLMTAALLAGSPPPPYRLDATEAASAFPGSRLTFTGVALADARTTVVERFAIACCRIDASPVSVTLDRRLAVPEGAWLTVDGTVRRGPTGALVLETSHWRRVARPADPFMYR